MLLHSFPEWIMENQVVLRDLIPPQMETVLLSESIAAFLDLDTARFAKMEIWADSELVDSHGSTTRFLPVRRTGFS